MEATWARVKDPADQREWHHPGGGRMSNDARIEYSYDRKAYLIDIRVHNEQVLFEQLAWKRVCDAKGVPPDVRRIVGKMLVGGGRGATSGCRYNAPYRYWLRIGDCFMDLWATIMYMYMLILFLLK